MSSPYRLDYEKVIVPETDSLLAVIPLSARNVILSLCEYLNWPAFWRANPPGPLEWDNIQSIIAELEQAMTTAISVQSLDDRLTEIKTAIEQIQPSGELDCSCFEALIPIIMGGSFPPLEPTDWSNPANDGMWDNPADAGTGPTDFSIAACRLAKQLVLSMADTLDGLIPVINLGASGNLIAAPIFLLAIPVIGQTFALSAATAAGIFAGILAAGSHATRTAADDLRGNADEIACVFDGVTLDDKNALRQFLIDVRSQYPYFVNVFLAAPMYGEKLVGELSQTNVNLWPGSDCNCPPEEVAGSKTWDFAEHGLGGGWSFVNSTGTPVPWQAVTGSVHTYSRECAYSCAVATSRPFVVTGNVSVHVSAQFLTGGHLPGRVEVRLQVKSGEVWNNYGTYYSTVTSSNINNYITLTAAHIALSDSDTYRIRVRIYSPNVGYYRQGWLARVRIA